MNSKNFMTKKQVFDFALTKFVQDSDVRILSGAFIDLSSGKKRKTKSFYTFRNPTLSGPFTQESDFVNMLFRMLSINIDSVRGLEIDKILSTRCSSRSNHKGSLIVCIIPTDDKQFIPVHVWIHNLDLNAIPEQDLFSTIFPAIDTDKHVFPRFYLDKTAPITKRSKDESLLSKNN